MSNVVLAIRPLLVLAGTVLLILTISRLALIMVFYSRVNEVDELGFVLSQGLRFDLVLVGMVVLIPIMLMPLLTTHLAALNLWRGLLTFWVPLVVMSVLFMELATMPFAEQFDVRPNVLFFEYFGHPKEILSTLWGAYRMPLIIGVLLTLSVGWGVHTLYRSMYVLKEPVHWAVAIPATVCLILVLGMMIRSTTDHRPVNPSTVARTTDTLVNDLPLNSLYTVAYAAYAMKNEEAGILAYGHMRDEDALALVKSDMAIDESLFVTPASTQRQASASYQSKSRRPKNLVILLQESLGAEFVGALGGVGVTPNIDALSAEGLWFQRLYATGTRSVRGIEAVMTGFPPTPARSVVKLNRSQSGFFTLASALGAQGYDTSFIYGGESHFDNMRRFFVGNGVRRIIDENDFEKPVFTGSWGVSDEDLMRRAHEEFEAQGDKPFFSLVFSSSNHTPFEFPDGRIELFDEQKQTVNNAVKYADYALGEFFKLARQSSYWDNTLFLIVADHNSRVYGDSIIPIERFHIPGLILGGGVEPAIYERIASQIDLAPTLLSMMGVDTVNPMPGRDLTSLSPHVPGRAMMQFNAVNAYMEGDKVAILRRDLPAESFTYNNNELVSTGPDTELQDKALAFVTWASNTYRDRAYALSDSKLPTQLSAGPQILGLNAFAGAGGKLNHLSLER